MGNARERKATVITIEDIQRFGIERVMEYALEIAWKGARAVWLSFDIDSVDTAFAPGTGTPEPGGLLPREVSEWCAWPQERDCKAWNW